MYREYTDVFYMHIITYLHKINHTLGSATWTRGVYPKFILVYHSYPGVDRGLRYTSGYYMIHKDTFRIRSDRPPRTHLIETPHPRRPADGAQRCARLAL